MEIIQEYTCQSAQKDIENYYKRHLKNDDEEIDGMKRALDHVRNNSCQICRETIEGFRK